jgi:hypothetical protein
MQRSSLVVIVLVWAGVAGAEIPCTYFAAPAQEDGGRVPEGQPFAQRFAVGTPDEPIYVEDFWARKLIKPGTALCLKDGEYRGKSSMIVPPQGRFHGTPAARVEIRAVNDGQVWIDGEFERTTLAVTQSYWTLSGFNVFNSPGAPVNVTGLKQEGDRDQEPVHHVELRRIVAWRDFIPFGTTADYDAAGGPNTHIYNIADVADILVEDSAGFGWGRKIFQNYRSNRVVLRRNWARWDGRYPYERGNKFAFSCAYQAYDALCENLIATVGGSRDPAAQPPTYAPAMHLIAIDGFARKDSRWIEPSGRDVHNLGLRITGSLAYTPPGAVYQAVTGIFVGGAVYPGMGPKNVIIDNSVASVANELKPALFVANCDDDPKEYPDGCSWERGDDRARAPLLLRRLSLRSGVPGSVRVGDDWRSVNVAILHSMDRQIDIYQGQPGTATLCRRYVDGAPTPLPLWPWPMQDRIRAATERSNWQTADVMGEITELFGPPPLECTTPVT